MVSVVEKKIRKEKLVIDGVIQPHLRETMLSARAKICELVLIFKTANVDVADAALFTEQMLTSMLLK
jgi:hypothetical protein